MGKAKILMSARLLTKARQYLRVILLVEGGWWPGRESNL